MKIQPGTIILIFMIIMFSSMIFLNSQARNYLERESNFDTVYNDDVYITFSTLQQDLDSKVTVLKKNQDMLDVFAETDGNLISIDSNADKLLVLTDTVVQIYNLSADEEDNKKPEEIAIANVQALLPFDLRSQFPVPNIEYARFNPSDPSELLFVLSQIDDNAVKFCFITRSGQGEYTLAGIPVLTVDKSVLGLRKTRIASLREGEFVFVSSFYTETESALFGYYSDSENWHKINDLNGVEAGYFALDKSNVRRLDILAQSSKGFKFVSIETKQPADGQMKSEFNSIYALKSRDAKMQNEIHSAYSIVSDDKNEYLFYNEEGKIHQARLINWENGSFSQVKGLTINTKPALLPELGGVWYAILVMLAGFVFVIIFAITKRRKGLKNMLSPVDFLEDTKISEQTKKEEDKPKLSENDKKLRLLGRNDVVRPVKEEIPDLGDPFSIHEHFGYIPAGLLIRTLAAGIDLIILAPLFYWLGGVLGIRIDDLFAGPDWLLAHVLIMFVHFVYFVGFEYYFAKTPGKMLAGIRTVTIENKQLKIWQVIVRNLTRIPDYYLFFVMMFNMRAQRIGDLLTKTVVIFDAKDKEIGS